MYKCLEMYFAIVRAKRAEAGTPTHMPVHTHTDSKLDL